MNESTPKEDGFYMAKSKSGHWFTVFCDKDGYAWTSEMYSWEDTPKNVEDFVEWIKVER